MVTPDQFDIDQQNATESNNQSAAQDQRLTSQSIRSFVIRNGRLTKAQAQAIEQLLPQFGLTFSNQALDYATVFGRTAPVWLEIGFGNGDALLDMAQQNPEFDFIGVEVHEPGVGQALMGIQARQLSNVRIVQHDAVEVLEKMIPANSLARVLLFFPDPWRKKRHFKRRIVQKEFLQLVSARLAENAILHCATDWEDYAHWMLEKLDQCDTLSNLAKPNDYSERPAWRTQTRFEQRGIRLGHKVYDLLYARC